MQSFYLDYHHARVHCLRFGQGERLLIALHGYGDRARLFAILAEALEEPYTVVAIDLPFHGQTEWPDDRFTKENLIDIIRLVLVQEKHSRFSMMGYSFGARLVQAMLPDFIAQLDKLYLLAPDGIRTKGMWMAVHTPMRVRSFLYRALQRPEWFLNLVRLGRKMRLLPPLIAHFLSINLSRPDRFQRTFGCWFALNSFYLRRRRIRAILHESELPVDLYFGTKDDMIRYKTVKKMTDSLPHARLFLLEEGHRIIGDNLRDAMLEG